MSNKLQIRPQVRTGLRHHCYRLLDYVQHLLVLLAFVLFFSYIQTVSASPTFHVPPLRADAAIWNILFASLAMLTARWLRQHLGQRAGQAKRLNRDGL